MGIFLGQVPEDVEALASKLDMKASEVETVIQTVNTQLGATNWVGSDRDNFEATWAGDHTNNLTQLANMLRETAQIARNNAQQQRTASS